MERITPREASILVFATLKGAVDEVGGFERQLADNALEGGLQAVLIRFREADPPKPDYEPAQARYELTHLHQELT
jgi:hypothetical protein